MGIGLTGVCSGGDRMSLVRTAIEWKNDLQPAACLVRRNELTVTGIHAPASSLQGGPCGRGHTLDSF